MIWLSVNRDFFICRSFCDHCKSLYSKPRLFSGGITPETIVIEASQFILKLPRQSQWLVDRGFCLIWPNPAPGIGIALPDGVSVLGPLPIALRTLFSHQYIVVPQVGGGACFRFAPGSSAQGVVAVSDVQLGLLEFDELAFGVEGSVFGGVAGDADFGTECIVIPFA